MTTPTTLLDTTTDTALSRMRAHKGNIPSLPQTKYCTLCPAKFTRTTHLNRHLRSHTNERLHRCNLCKSSEFTRSDLLTRHKRTCGQSVNRSRRKSCEACAESKIKCNLQYPCAKCTSRGRECVFQNDPEESRNKSLSTKGGSRKPTTAPKPLAAVSPPTSPLSASPTIQPAVPPSSDCPDTCESSRASSASPTSHLLRLPELSDSPASSESSSFHSSPRSDDFPTFDEPFDFPFDVGLYNDPLASLSPLEQALFPCTSGFSSSTGDETKQPESQFNHDSTEVNSSVLDQHDLFASLIRSPEPFSAQLSTPFMSQPTVTLDCLETMDVCRSEVSDTYLHLFFARFLTQVPLIHATTWKMESTPPTLMRIFQACGALFVKTPEASEFVSKTLISVTAEISEEFTTVSESSDCIARHTHLIIALVLLQTICLFQREGQGPTPNVQHHAMLITMIRQTGLINRVGSWKAPDWSDPISLEAAWIEWIHFATIKRALLLSYFHDCCHCMYSASPPSFSPAELDVHLPCDDALWQAASATEWFDIAHTPSPYGIGIERIYGVSMQYALTTLGQGEKSSIRLSLNPFALFILIHTILRNISVSQAESRAPPVGGWSCFAMVSSVVPDDFTFITQLVLDNWLHLWLNSPDAKPQDSAKEPPFVYNSLPFYWLAQVSLWENVETRTDAKTQLVNGWVGQVRSLLYDDSKSSPHLQEIPVDQVLLL